MKAISWFYKNDDHILRLINRCQGCCLFYGQLILWLLSYTSLLFIQITSSLSGHPYLKIALTITACWIGFFTIKTLWISHFTRVFLSRKDPLPEEPKECEKCKLKNKSENDHHCFLCNRCIRGMDHHCLFIHNCVGSANHKSFLGFLLYSILSAILFLIYDGLQMYYTFLAPQKAKLKAWFFWLMLEIFLSVLILIGVGFLLFSQTQYFAMGLRMVELKYNLRPAQINTFHFLRHPCDWCRRAKRGMRQIAGVAGISEILLQ